MRLKKLGAALVVVAALGAVLASSAFAAATTTDVKWYTGASPGTELSGSAEAKTSQVGSSTFETTVSGVAIKLHSTNTECVECKIENSGGTAVGSGKAKFTGVTVQEPATCSVASSITTTKLTWKADYMIGTVNYILFEPAAGSTTAMATIELTGASCPIKTAIVPKGTVFVKMQNTTGTQAAEQKVNLSAAINTTAGGTLHVGEEPASMSAVTANRLASGSQFGTH